MQLGLTDDAGLLPRGWTMLTRSTQKVSELGGVRTLDPQIRSLMRYPLRYKPMIEFQREFPSKYEYLQLTALLKSFHALSDSQVK